VRLRAVSRTQGNNAALKDGTVGVRGHELEFEEVPVLVRAFRRMVRELAWDVSEMAFTTYLCARAHGTRFTALPVFLVRGFHHGAIVRGPAAGIAGPRDLEGRTVGVNRGYTVTTGVWARGILARDHGVALDRVTWARSGDEHVAEYVPPGNVVSLPEGSDLAALVSGGELPAAVGLAADGTDLEPVIPDPTEAAFAALRDRGLYPINHLVVVRDELLAADPDLAASVFEAFAEAKRRYVEELRAGAIAEPSATDLMYARVMAETGDDPLPYGVGPNRAMIEELLDHAVDQRILDRRPAVEDLFAERTLGLVA
jgi:4,5-dihydroxyphthalate decarboxylase